MAINERDEIERISSLMQRDNLLKTLGIPDFVYRLLQGLKSTGRTNENYRTNENKSYVSNLLYAPYLP